jgi:hypothetical protein
MALKDGERFRMEIVEQQKLRALLAAIDTARAIATDLLAEQTAEASEADMTRYRRYPGGPLSEAGEAEIQRRFDAGQTDSVIALGMGISLTGVAKRRGMWRQTKGKGPDSRTEHTTTILDPSATRYRRYPGGPLSEAGEAEIQRRFEAGQADSAIALAMEISLTGVARRRGMWRRSNAK